MLIKSGLFKLYYHFQPISKSHSKKFNYSLNDNDGIVQIDHPFLERYSRIRQGLVTYSFVVSFDPSLGSLEISIRPLGGQGVVLDYSALDWSYCRTILDHSSVGSKSETLQ